MIAALLLVMGVLFSQPLAVFFQLPDRSALFMVLIILALSILTPVVSAPWAVFKPLVGHPVSGMSWGGGAAVIRRIACRLCRGIGQVGVGRAWGGRDCQHGNCCGRIMGHSEKQIAHG